MPAPGLPAVGIFFDFVKGGLGQNCLDMFRIQFQLYKNTVLDPDRIQFRHIRYIVYKRT